MGAVGQLRIFKWTPRFASLYQQTTSSSAPAYEENVSVPKGTPIPHHKAVFVAHFDLGFQEISPTGTFEAVKSLSEIARFTFADTFRHYEPADLESYLEKALSPEALEKELSEPNNKFYFVTLNGILTGYLKWIFPSTVYLEHANLDCRRPFLIERFYFLPEYQGKGLADIALAFITSFAKYEAGADYLYLSVWEKNYRAQRFYQKHGFRTLASFGYPVGDVVDQEFLYGKQL
jgi:ribosomal protein S18 acetylase RimI-like enzyme